MDTNSQSSVLSRDTTVDILRGIAIFTMFAANMAALVLAEPHPMWFRFYGTFAAPLFIFLSGMMVAFGATKKKQGFNYFLKRGFLIVIIGALIDIGVYQIFPFTTFDVLYLIGISIPIIYLIFQSKSTPLQIIIALAILGVAPLLQKIWGYHAYPTEYYFDGTILPEDPSQRGCLLQNWFIDGWFPVFPWLGFAVLGAIFSTWRAKLWEFNRFLFLMVVVLFLVTGGILFHLSPGELYSREGYSELFYPVTYGFIFLALGVIGLLFYLVQRMSSLRIYLPLQMLGEVSLLMYILHQVIIRYIYGLYWPEQSMTIFIILYAVLAAALLLVAYGIRLLKKRWQQPPYLIRLLLGG